MENIYVDFIQINACDKSPMYTVLLSSALSEGKKGDYGIVSTHSFVRPDKTLRTP